MSASRWIWLVASLLYGAFFYWYTSFDGPLTAEEIDTYMARLSERAEGASPEQLANLRRFMEEDTGDDFVMLNVIDMYETPQQIEGVDPGDSSPQVLNKYMAYMYPALFSRACHPIMAGSAAATALDLMNAPGMAQWTTGALMRYRSRRDMLDISTNPEFQGAHAFKIAAMEKTIAFPLDPWFQLGDPRLVLALVFALIASVTGRLLGK